MQPSEIPRLTRVPIAVVALFATIGPAVAQQPDPAVTAFVNVNVIPMDRERVERAQTVVIRDGRINAIGRTGDIKPPDHAFVVDGHGRYLLPGLTDSHVHITTDMPWAATRPDFGDALLYLAHGVTTVVNQSGLSPYAAIRAATVNPAAFRPGDGVRYDRGWETRRPPAARPQPPRQPLRAR